MVHNTLFPQPYFVHCTSIDIESPNLTLKNVFKNCPESQHVFRDSLIEKIIYGSIYWQNTIFTEMFTEWSVSLHLPLQIIRYLILNTTVSFEIGNNVTVATIVLAVFSLVLFSWMSLALECN